MSRYENLSLKQWADRRDAERMVRAADDEAEDATAGLPDWEKAEAAKLSAQVVMTVATASTVGNVMGRVADAGAFQLAVLRLALATIETMEEIHGEGGMAGVSEG